MTLHRHLILFSCLFVTSYAFTLSDGFNYALDNDMDSKVNENNIKNIKFDQEIADSLMNPTVDFNATVETSKVTEGDISPKKGSHTKTDEYKFTLTQPIFDGFESSNEKELQKYKYNSAVFYLKESQNSVALNYTQSYINTLRQKDLLNLNKEAVIVSEEIFNKVYRKVSSGYGTKLEFDESKSQLAENKVNLKTQKINFKEAIENLKFYVQKDFDTSELIKPSFYYPLPKTLDEAMEIAKEKNPSLKVSKINLKVAVAQERKNDKNFYPSLDLVGSYQINDAVHNSNEENNEYKIGFQLNYNLYNGGKDTLEKKKALQNIKEKQFLITKTEYQIKNKLRLAWNSYKLNQEKYESLQQYLLVKKDVLDATIKEFDLGLKDLSSLLDIHTEYIDVKKDFITNTYDLLLSKYRVLDGIGVLSDSLQDKMPSLEKIKIKNTINLFNETDYSYNKASHLDKKKIAYKSDDISINKKLPPLKLAKNANDIIFGTKIDNSVKSDSSAKVEKATYYKTTKEENIDISFKEKFLNAPSNKYTINLALSGSQKKAQSFIDRFDLEEKAFFFSFRFENPLQKIMMGIYDTKEEALEVINNLPKSLKRNQPIVESISLKQKLFEKYHKSDYLDLTTRKTEQKLAKYKSNSLIKKVSFSSVNEEVQTTKIDSSIKEDKSFKQKFLNASKDKYTINLAFSDSKKKAQYMIDRYDLEDKAFFFKFRYEDPLQKIVLGVFDSKEEAKEALKSLPKGLLSNQPIIEKITRKQKLYHKYNTSSHENTERI